MAERWKGFNIPVYTNNNPGMISNIQLATQEYGANVLRCQITDDPTLLPDMGDQAAYLSWLNKKIDSLKVAADAALQFGSKIIIAQFQPFGGVTTNAFGRSTHRFLVEAFYRNCFYQDWAYIAETFKDHEGVLGYDLINEPHHRKMKKLMPILLTTGGIIREKNKDQKIIFSTLYGNPTKIKSFRRWVPQMKELKKCWVTVHMYHPNNITHQGLPDASCSIKHPIGSRQYPSNRFNREKMAAFMQPIKDFAKQYRVPVFIGEFSCTRWSGHPHTPNAYNYLKDLTDIMNGHKFHWAYHAFMEAGMWRLDFSTNPCTDICNPHCQEASQVTDRTLLMKEALR